MPQFLTDDELADLIALEAAAPPLASPWAESSEVYMTAEGYRFIERVQAVFPRLLAELQQARRQAGELEQAQDEAMNERAGRRAVEIDRAHWQESFRDVVHQRDRWERLYQRTSSDVARSLAWTKAMLLTNDDLCAWVDKQPEETLRANGFLAIWERSAARLASLTHPTD